jgi:hypothetical protein
VRLVRNGKKIKVLQVRVKKGLPRGLLFALFAELRCRLFELNPVTGETSPKGDIPAANFEAKSPSFEATSPANDQAAVEKFNGAATEGYIYPAYRGILAR